MSKPSHTRTIEAGPSTAFAEALLPLGSRGRLGGQAQMLTYEISEKGIERVSHSARPDLAVAPHLRGSQIPFACTRTYPTRGNCHAYGRLVDSTS